MDVCVNAQLPPQAVAELVVLSDELNINEVVCVELWSQVTPVVSCVKSILTVTGVSPC